MSALNQARFLRMLRAQFPAGYIDGIEQSKDGGWELMLASSAIGERVSQAIDRLESACFIGRASGGTLSTGVVSFARVDTSQGTYTIKSGTVVTTADGRDFITTSDATWPSGTLLGPISVGVQAIAKGYEYNVPGISTTAHGETIPGAITTIKALRTDPNTWDSGLSVSQPSATTGGTPASLDALGYDLGVIRIDDSESDDAYRARIRTTPDTVSPAAIRRAFTEILAAKNTSGILLEIGTRVFPGIFLDAGSSLDLPQDPGSNFACDMSLSFSNADMWKVLVDHSQMRGFFIVCVPVLPSSDTSTYGAIWDMLVSKHLAGVGFDMYLLD